MAAAEQPATFPPVHGTDVTRLDPEYVARRDAAGEHFFALADGRQLCYSRQEPEPAAGGSGAAEPPTLVLAFHGGGEGKGKFLQRRGLEGILLVAIDRPGYGKSSDPPDAGYTFARVAADVGALADHLGHAQFVVAGHSIGGMWAQQVAAHLPERVRGVVLFASVVDLAQPGVTRAHAKAVGRPPAPLHPTRGALSCVLASSFTSYAKLGGRYEFKEHLKHEAKTPFFPTYAADPFWVSTTVESWRAFDRPAGILRDAEMCLFGGTHGATIGGAWAHRDVTSAGVGGCPVFVYHGDADYDLGTKYPGAVDALRATYGERARVEVVRGGVGHVLVLGPTEQTRARIKAAVGAMPLLPSGIATY